ncbi:MAG: efflux RND transporter permease subunit [Candidatus Aminicenantes bacterium]|nr:efflux RND transporter permease subunit [Candidatus Aminicenantes bacterium]
MKIVDFSLKKRVTMSMVVLVIVILGMISFTKLGLDMLPDLDYPVITVITTYGGVSSEDIEQNITRPVEQWISTVSGIKKLNSISLEGQSVVMVEFEWGTNLDFAAQDVRDTIGLYDQFLPKGANKPFVMKFNFSQMPILAYGMTGGDMNLSKLRDYIDNEVATRLERIEGVASAAVFSPEVNEVLVSIDKGKLESRGLNIGQVEMAIQTSNINLPAGYMTENHREFLLRTMGEFKSLAEIDHILVGMSRSGAPIFLKDVGSVKESPKETRLKLRMNGEQGIMMMVTKSSGANSVLVARQVKKILAEVEPTLKGGVKFHMWLDMSRIIEMMSSKATKNIMLGGILAMLIIFLFLRNIKPTVAIGITIPLSIVVAFIAFYMMGYTLNLITLGGLALGVGMLVDNAVVVIENIYRHLQEGMSPTEAARKGTSEVGMAIAASTLTTISVFFPMMFATGIAGRMAQSLAVSVIIALLASLFVALTIVPMLAAWMFRVRVKKAVTSNSDIVALGEDNFTPLRDRYEGILRKALANRKKVLIGIIALFVLSLVGAAFLGKEFMPATDNSMLYLKLSMPVGTNIEQTDRIVKYLENQSLKDPNVITTFVQVGTSEMSASDTAQGTGAAGSYEAIIYAYLKPSSQRSETDKQILERWRKSFPTLENSQITSIDLGASMFGSSSSPIEVACFGRDMGRLEGIAENIRASINDIEGIRDVKITLEKSKPELQLHIKKEEASKLGLTPYAISSQVQTYTIGTVVSRMFVEGEDRDIRVQLNESDRASLEDLKKLPIKTPTGAKVYLSEVAEFKDLFGPVRIDRENMVRKVTIGANFVGSNLGAIVAQIKKKIRNITSRLPEGYFVEIGGQYENMTETFTTLTFALLIALVLVFAVMASLYENLKFPFINMFALPLAFIGVVLMLAVTGKTINMGSIMGFIILAGIAVNNGIVMVDYINKLIDSGMEKLAAVIKGAATRLRPILITSLTTMGGMVPMALTHKEGGEMNSPMAIAIIGGLLASTFMTLFFIPILYTYFAKIKTGNK